MQKYEKGTNRVGGGRLKRIADVFGVPVTALYEGAPGEAHAGATSALALIKDREPMRLVQAFAAIGHRSTRQSIVELVENVAALDGKRPAPARVKPTRKRR